MREPHTNLYYIRLPHTTIMSEKNSTKPMNVTNPAYQMALKKRIQELTPEKEKPDDAKKEENKSTDPETGK